MFKKNKKHHHIQVRYNTNAGNSPLVWRVIVDGKEHLASHVDINGWVFSEASIVNEQRKMNLACYGSISWRGTQVEINAMSRPPRELI